MEKDVRKREDEIAKEILGKYKQELMYNIDGYPDDITHDGLKQVLNIVRLE